MVAVSAMSWGLPPASMSLDSPDMIGAGLDMQVVEHVIQMPVASTFDEQDVNPMRKSAIVLLVCSEPHLMETGLMQKMWVM